MSFKNSNVEQTVATCWKKDWIYVVHSPSSSYFINSVAACVINAIFVIAGSILNSLVISIFWKSAKIRKKIPYFMIMVLSSNDLAVVTIAQSLFLFQSVTEILEAPKCLYKALYQVATVTLAGTSAMTLSVMNIERSLSILRPVFHYVTITKGKCLLILISSWFIVVAVISLRFFWSTLAHVLIAINVAYICFTSLFTYLSIFYVARNSLLSVSRVNNPNNRETPATNLRSFLRELKTAKTSVLIVSLCLVCYLPTIIIFGIMNRWSANDKTLGTLAQANMWSDTLGFMNSTLNCVIFFWSNRELKKQGLKIMKERFSG